MLTGPRPAGSGRVTRFAGLASVRISVALMLGCGLDGPRALSHRPGPGWRSAGGGPCSAGGADSALYRPRSRSPPEAAEPESAAASPRRKKKRRGKPEAGQEAAEEEQPEDRGHERQRGPAVPGSSPLPAAYSQGPGDLAGLCAARGGVRGEGLRAGPSFPEAGASGCHLLGTGPQTCCQAAVARGSGGCSERRGGASWWGFGAPPRASARRAATAPPGVLPWRARRRRAPGAAGVLGRPGLREERCVWGLGLGCAGRGALEETPWRRSQVASREEGPSGLCPQPLGSVWDWCLWGGGVCGGVCLRKVPSGFSLHPGRGSADQALCRGRGVAGGSPHPEREHVRSSFLERGQGFKHNTLPGRRGRVTGQGCGGGRPRGRRPRVLQC